MKYHHRQRYSDFPPNIYENPYILSLPPSSGCNKIANLSPYTFYGAWQSSVARDLVFLAQISGDPQTLTTPKNPSSAISAQSFLDVSKFPLLQFVYQNEVNPLLEFENILKTLCKICITYSSILMDATFISNNVLLPCPVFRPSQYVDIHDLWYSSE